MLNLNLLKKRFLDRILLGKDPRLVVDEVIHAIYAYGDHEFKKTLNSFKSIDLFQNQPEFLRLLMDWLYLLRLQNFSMSDFYSYSESISLHLAKINLNSYDLYQWNLIRYTLIKFGFLVASNIARENQIHLSLASNDITFRVKALLDLGSSSKAYNLFSKYTNSFNRTQINYLNAIFSFLSYPVAGENILTSDSSDFGEIILRKKIVLSGPLSDVESLLKDSHVLVNVNHRNLVFDYQPTISYYSGGMANLIHDNNIQLNEKIDFAVLKNAASESYFKKFISHKSRVPVRSAIYASGSPNLIQFALLDLLNFNPSEIYVSGINFGLSKVTHKRNYHNLHVIENGSLSGRRKFIYTHPSSGSSFINCRTHGIARHDRISQLNFCSLLAASERINFDPSIKSILDQTPDVFYSELEKFVIST